MGNCLVTKLKGVVNNDNLLKVGEVVIKFHPSASLSDPYNRRLVFGNLDQVNPTTIRIIGNGHFTDSTFTQDLGKTISRVGDIETYVSNEIDDVTVACGINYRIGSLLVGYHGYMDIDQLKYNQFQRCSSIRFLNGAKPNPITGNIESFKNFWKQRTQNDGYLQISSDKIEGSLEAIDFTGHMTRVNVGGCDKITGNIENMNFGPNLADLGISFSKLSGSIETMLQNLLTAGKVGNLTLMSAANLTSWHGVVGGLEGNLVVTFATNSIEVNRNNVTIASYNGSTWTYYNN